MKTRGLLIAAVMSLFLAGMMVSCGESIGNIEGETKGNSTVLSVNAFSPDSFSVYYTLYSQWNSGFNASLTISNKSVTAIKNWELEFSAPFTITSIWNASVINHTGNMFKIKSADWNKDIPPFGTVNFGFIGGGNHSEPTGYILIGSGTSSSTGISSFSSSKAAVSSSSKSQSHAVSSASKSSSRSSSSSTSSYVSSVSSGVGQVKWAGVRESYYGITENGGSFLSMPGWAKAMNSMAGKWQGSAPTAVWLVSEVDFGTTGIIMQFASNGTNYNNVIFEPYTVDHEAYLDYFDQNGIKVFLQLEPGFADMNTCIDLVLNQFKHHPCVVGLGVDVEWYQCATDGGNATPVSDALAKSWEARVKSHNAAYRLFLKHYDLGYLPVNYRGDIIFIDDTEQNGSFSNFLMEHKNFADFFYPSDVMYQIGYPSDKQWWGSFSDAPKTMGDALVNQTKQNNCGIIWVDFSLRDVLPYQ